MCNLCMFQVVINLNFYHACKVFFSMQGSNFLSCKDCILSCKDGIFYHARIVFFIMQGLYFYHVRIVFFIMQGLYILEKIAFSQELIHSSFHLSLKNMLGQSLCYSIGKKMYHLVIFWRISRVGHPFFSKERSVLCVLFRSL